MHVRVLYAISIATCLAGPAAAQLAEGNPAAVDPVEPVPGGITSTSGGLTGFDDRNAWAAAASGDITTITFESIAHGTPIDGELGPQGVIGVTGGSTFVPGFDTQQFVTASTLLPFPMFTTGTLPSEPNFLSNDLASPGFATGEITFEFANPTTATGAFVADGAPLGGFTIEVFDGALSLGSIGVGPRTLPDSFVGIVSTVPFTSARYVADSSGDSWGLDNVEHNGNAECYLFLGLGSAFYPLPMSPEDTLLVLPDWSFPVALDDIPVWTIPHNASLIGTNLYAQVYMDNAVVFPEDQYKLSNGVRATIGIGSTSYGPSTGMQLWLEQEPLIGNQLEFKFSIDGF